MDSKQPLKVLCITSILIRAVPSLLQGQNNSNFIGILFMGHEIFVSLCVEYSQNNSARKKRAKASFRFLFFLRAAKDGWRKNRIVPLLPRVYSVFFQRLNAEGSCKQKARKEYKKTCPRNKRGEKNNLFLLRTHNTFWETANSRK